MSEVKSAGGRRRRIIGKRVLDFPNALLDPLRNSPLGGVIRVVRRYDPSFIRHLRARRMGPLTVRVLGLQDVGIVDVFTGKYLPRLHAHIIRQCVGRWPTKGFAVGAFRADGELIGFVFVDEYLNEGVPLPGWWVRGLKMIPNARRIGGGTLLMRCALAEAEARGLSRVYIDVFATNARSVALMQKLGLPAASVKFTDEVNRVFASKSHERRVVFEYRCGSDLPDE